MSWTPTAGSSHTDPSQVVDLGEEGANIRQISQNDDSL